MPREEYDDPRTRLAEAQRRLVEALVERRPEGTGIDPVAFEIQAALLAYRRAQLSGL